MGFYFEFRSISAPNYHCEVSALEDTVKSNWVMLLKNSMQLFECLFSAIAPLGALPGLPGFLPSIHDFQK